MPWFIHVYQFGLTLYIVSDLCNPPGGITSQRCARHAREDAWQGGGIQGDA